jgi:lantibiotic biosynthesis protein
MSESIHQPLPFYFAKGLLLRTPALPFLPAPDQQTLTGLLNDQRFLEAIYMASPVLYREAIRMKMGEITDAKEKNSILSSLVKYYQRMYSRSTPFGLFSGCAVLQWDEKDDQVIIPASAFRRSTRLDMHYCCALGQSIAAHPAVQERLLFYSNNSAYPIGEELRYIEYRYQSGKRVHQISSVAWSDYLKGVLDKAINGVQLKELIALLVAEAAVETEEAKSFIQDMVDAQVLIPETDPSITGTDFIRQLLTVLQRINQPEDPDISRLIHQITSLVASLGEADQRFTNGAEFYNGFQQAVHELHVEFEEAKLLQVDMFSRPVQDQLSDRYQQDLLKAATAMTRLFCQVRNENLDAFAEKFRKRYEDRSMPLLQVLDAETGIGYPEQSGSNLSPLVNELQLPARTANGQTEIKWNQTEEWLFKKLLDASGKNEIEISLDELTELEWKPELLPPSLSLMFSLVTDKRILIRGISGSSAVNLLGRFAAADPGIATMAQEIVAAEEKMNPDILFAEIVHLPEDRVGNILLHPAFRQWEIPFLARASVEKENQIPLQDILIRVLSDKKIRLFSASSGKEIIPRLSNAHNFSFRSLPVYHFLADMQTQGLCNGFSWNWGIMSRHFKKLPAVRMGNILLNEACWQLLKSDFEGLLQTGDPVELMREFCTKWGLPEKFVQADGDHEMLVDRNSPESVTAFIKAIRGRQSIVLKEFLLPDPEAVVNEQGQAYCNQFIAALVKNTNVYQPDGVFHQADSGIQRNFLPGSSWLYYKIYCGSKSADEILLNVIQQLTVQLQSAGLISHWFFIRYNDPDFHIRFRMKMNDPLQAGWIMQAFLKMIEPFESAGLIWKIQLDTYQRETERYGEELTDYAEELFAMDSRQFLFFLEIAEGDEREDLRWPWALISTDALLTHFGYDAGAKYLLMQALQKQFAAEFRADKAMFKQQYNQHRGLINQLLDPKRDQQHPLITLIIQHTLAIKEIAAKILNAVNNSQVALDNLMGSYIHMSLNRVFLSEPRLHEFVIYDYLCSYYRSAFKRKAMPDRE